jgi:hypothetical protein
MRRLALFADDREVLHHYESQTDEEPVAEDEASFEGDTETVMRVPSQLVPTIRRLIGKLDSPNVEG